MTDYKDIIIDHYKNPRHFGEMSDPDSTQNESNSSCGDMIQLQVKWEEGKISDVKWRGVGCAISTAAASLLSEKIIGLNKKEIEEIGDQGIVSMLGGEVNAGRMKCATLGYRALIKIIELKK